MHLKRFATVLTVCLAAGLHSSLAAGTEGPVREPVMAGRFYPEQSSLLGVLVDNYLKAARPPEVSGSIKALILPHAGYPFSAHVAAFGYKCLDPSTIDTVILVGRSHCEHFDGASVYPKGAFRTPLGDVPVNVEMAARIMAANNKFRYFEPAHDREHSLEVQLPFLQRILKTFTIVPIIIGDDTATTPAALAKAIQACLNDRTLVIASSDMSHYPSGDNARRADNETIKAILTGSVAKLDETMAALSKENIPNEETFLCGGQAVKTVMLLSNAIGAKKITFLKYANSGDVNGERDRVVGYCAIAFSASGNAGAKAPAVKPEGQLSPDEQKVLLRLARRTIENHLKGGRALTLENPSPSLERHLGAFVTLRKHGDLRGCIGRFEPDIPLHQVVVNMAISAATQDPRFEPVTASELKDLDIEISVLSPLRRVKDWHEIQVGKHGVQVVKGYRAGVFLPQVATENHWDLETFMNVLCEQKAGLPRSAWKDPSTELYVFTAQVFGEKE
jgi:AmmeMemoRadiSam system protein B/AmmeMemoRadiSam system protein A